MISAPRPWYFKDGTPINADAIRKILNAAKIRTCREPERPAPISRKEVCNIARYFAEQVQKKMQRDIEHLILAEFESLRRRPIIKSGDADLDEKRHWRRAYMRQYRLKQREVCRNGS